MFTLNYTGGLVLNPQLQIHQIVKTKQMLPFGGIKSGFTFSRNSKYLVLINICNQFILN